MQMNQIQTGAAPQPIGPYSQAIEAGGMIFCSGALGVDPTTSAIIGTTIEEQTEQALKNIQAILQEAGSSLRHVVKTTVLLKDMGDFAAFNLVYGKIMTEAKGDDMPMPARTTYAVAGLPMKALVEIDCTALKVVRHSVKAQRVVEDIVVKKD